MSSDNDNDYKTSVYERWEDYQPTKTVLFWSIAGAVVATLLLGFNVAGWTTASKAEEMARQSSQQATAELASLICVERFMASDDAAASLVRIGETRSSFQRRQMIEAGGWATLSSDASTNRRAATMCGDALFQEAQLMEAPETTS